MSSSYTPILWSTYIDTLCLHNVHERRTFLGLADYYKRFVKGFSSIVGPLTKLTQKNVKFEWNEAYKKIFQELKDRLMSTPILTLPLGSRG